MKFLEVLYWRADKSVYSSTISLQKRERERESNYLLRERLSLSLSSPLSAMIYGIIGKREARVYIYVYSHRYIYAEIRSEERNNNTRERLQINKYKWNKQDKKTATTLILQRKNFILYYIVQKKKILQHQIILLLFIFKIKKCRK